MNGLPNARPCIQPNVATKPERDDEYEDSVPVPVPVDPAKAASQSFYNFSTSIQNVASGGSASGGSSQNQNSSIHSVSSSSARNQCCLIDDGKRCHRAAGNASYSKRIQKTVYYKRLRLETDHNAQHIYICDYHKMVIQNARTRQKKDSEEDANETDEVPEVDLYQLQVNTLRRYKKHFKLSSRPGLNKAQLSDILMRHFRTIPVVEKEIVTYFIYTVKSERNKLEHNRHDAPGELELY